MTWRGDVEWLEEGSKDVWEDVYRYQTLYCTSFASRNANATVFSNSFSSFPALLISIFVVARARRSAASNGNSETRISPFESCFFLSPSSIFLRLPTMSPFDIPESDKITLVTADEPPQHFIVSRSRLMVLSNVFRDLLSTPTTAEDEAKGEIRLTEEAEELEGFLMVLQDEEDKLSKLYFGDWYALARMADKFDCQAASNAALMRAW